MKKLFLFLGSAFIVLMQKEADAQNKQPLFPKAPGMQTYQGKRI